MSTNDSNITVKNNQVQFSKEVLEYFKSIETKENKEWINKYFGVLSNVSNLTAEKYNKHHIRPVFTFKDKEHKNRRQTEKLGNEFNGNIIKVSIYNHLFAHFYLWKIFNNQDSKIAFQRMCGQGKYIDNLTEDELKEVAKLKEECSERNQTKEELLKRIYRYNHSKDRVERIRERNKIRYLDPVIKDYVCRQIMLKRMRLNKEKYLNINVKDLKITIINSKEYNETMINFKLQKQKLQKLNKNESTKNWKNKNKEYIKNYTQNYRKKNKENILNMNRKYQKLHFDKLKQYKKRPCFDFIKQEYCIYETLKLRKTKNKNLYKNIVLKDWVLSIDSLIFEKILEKQETLKILSSIDINNKSKRLCYDPIAKKYCTYSALRGRKIRYKEKYKNVIIRECLIND